VVVSRQTDWTTGKKSFQETFMKKLTFVLLTILVITLTACGSASNGTVPSSVSQNGAPTGELPVTTQLIIGTLELDETENAVTAEQAAELLPLWQTLQVLSESDTAAQQETDALITQIQETMTAEQMQAITDMSLTREDMMSIMQQQGLTMGNGSQSSSSQSGNSSNGGGRVLGPGGGGPPDEMPMPGGGGMPAGGFGPSGQGQNLSEDAIATAQASRQANANFVPPMLLNAVIEYLQGKAGS
jgi:hypothetical protein